MTKKKPTKKPTKKAAKRPKKALPGGRRGEEIMEALAVKASIEIQEEEDKHLVREIGVSLLSVVDHARHARMLGRIATFKRLVLHAIVELEEDLTDRFLEANVPPVKPAKKRKVKRSKKK